MPDYQVSCHFYVNFCFYVYKTFYECCHFALFVVLRKNNCPFLGHNVGGETTLPLHGLGMVAGIIRGKS